MDENKMGQPAGFTEGEEAKPLVEKPGEDKPEKDGEASVNSDVWGGEQDKPAHRND